MNKLIQVPYLISAFITLPALLLSTSVSAGAIYSSDVMVELTYSVTGGDIGDLDVYGETLMFSSAAIASGTAIATSSGSPDSPVFTSPLSASASGETFSIADGFSLADWSVDAFMEFDNIGTAGVELTFDFSWRYAESTAIDDPAFDFADASSFILLTEILDDAGIVDLFEVDTFFDPSQPDSDFGSLSFVRTIGVGEFYALEVAITADGEAESFANITPPSVPEPSTFYLALIAFAGLLGRGIRAS